MPNLQQPIRFQGQWLDEETGLYYNRYRYYDPKQGRYITQDPIGLAGGLNSYAYVANPTGWADPLGLDDTAPWRYRIDPNVHPIRNVPKMFMQYVHQVVLPSKETAQTVSDVAAGCSLAPVATPFCTPVSLGSGIYAASTELSKENYNQFAIDIIPIAASKTDELFAKKLA